MKIYSPLNKVVRVTIEDQNTGTIIENTVKFSIAESNCEEVCKLIEKSFKNNLLPVITGAREIGKSRSVKIDISSITLNNGADFSFFNDCTTFIF